MEEKKRLASFNDLEVYRNSYNAMLTVMKEIVIRLPDSEKYDLKDQLSRACKAIPRLIAEGYAKRNGALIPGTQYLILLLSIFFNQQIQPIFSPQ